LETLPLNDTLIFLQLATERLLAWEPIALVASGWDRFTERLVFFFEVMNGCVSLINRTNRLINKKLIGF
jgi:hypothetical protein